MDLWRATSRWVGGASWVGRYKSLLAVALNRLKYIRYLTQVTYVFMRNCRVDFPQNTARGIMRIINSRPRNGRRLPADFRAADRIQCPIIHCGR